MIPKIISPKQHCLIDYALVSSLLIIPSVLDLPKKAKALYAAQALGLLGYVALSDSPVAVKPVIPFPVHGKIDPFNVAQFALQSFLPFVKKNKKGLIFNICFTAVAGITVLLTNWNGPTKH